MKYEEAEKLEDSLAFIKSIGRNYITIVVDKEEYDIPVDWDWE